MFRDSLGKMHRCLSFAIVGLLAFVVAGRAQNPGTANITILQQGPATGQGQGGEQPSAPMPPPGDPQSRNEPVSPAADAAAGKSGKADSDTGYRFGYDPGKGFFFDAATTTFPKLADGNYPFELQVRGRIQADYYGYRVNDQVNHLTGLNVGANTAPDESVFEIKRMRLIFAGWLFDDDLRYQIQLDGNTRGLATQDPRQNFFNNPIGNVSGGQNISNVDAGMRVLEAWMAYDIKGEADCHGYRNTFTLIAGKLKPMGSFEEYLGSANGQFVEYGMSSWMFDSDADNYLFGAGFQIHALEDRFFAMALITNGADNQIPAYNLDDVPGFNVGWWYDFGGTWDDKTQRWKLYGNSISDIDWSENPVLRVGSAANLTPMGRRSQYTTAELDFYRAATAAPGGSNLDNVLGGGGLGTGGNFKNVGMGISPFAVDAFDAYTFDFFYAFKWQGFSFYNEYWIRDYDNFRGLYNSTRTAELQILYTFTSPLTGKSSAALFNKTGMVDTGGAFQAGYFLIPNKLELAVRYDFINGESGDVNGNGTFATLPATALGIRTAAPVGGMQPANTVPLGTKIAVVNGAFSHFHLSQEIAVGLNVFFHGEQVKWQTDVGTYTGGNPAANGQSPAGYIPGVNGYLVRTQLQLFF